MVYTNRLTLTILLRLGFFLLHNNRGFIEIGVLFELFVDLMVQVDTAIKAINFNKTFERYFGVG